MELYAQKEDKGNYQEWKTKCWYLSILYLLLFISALQFQLQSAITLLQSYNLNERKLTIKTNSALKVQLNQLIRLNKHFIFQSPMKHKKFISERIKTNFRQFRWPFSDTKMIIMQNLESIKKFLASLVSTLIVNLWQGLSKNLSIKEPCNQFFPHLWHSGTQLVLSWRQTLLY